MSLLWVVAERATDDYIMSEPDEGRYSKSLYEQSGVKRDSPDYGEDPDFDEVFDHVVTHADTGSERNMPRCKDCRSGSHRLDLSQPLHGNEMHFDPEHISDLVRGQAPPRKSLPVVIQHKGENHIIDGHHRIMAAHLRGDSHIDVDLHHPDHILGER